MYQKVLTTVLVFIALVFIGTGITGFVTLEQGSACVKDNDCGSSVCCPLYGQSNGVCGQKEDCANLYLGSIKEANKGTTAQPSNAPIEGKVERNYIAFALGIIILLIIALVSFFEWEAKRIQRPRSAKKRAKR